MNASENVVYFTTRLNAFFIISFMKNYNFYDKELEDRLVCLIDKINEFIKDEC